MKMHLHVLNGCAPVPLANYLKALGVLRLVAEQADPNARGWWENDRFHLLSTLSREELETFFLERYEPTPIIAPWNGGSGFFAKDNREAIKAIQRSSAPRFASFRRAIEMGELATKDLKSKPEKDEKLRVFRFCLRYWRERHRDWLDAAVSFDPSGKPIYPSLLGTGGNDGRLEFTNNYMQQIASLFDLQSETAGPRPNARRLLCDSLWAELADDLVNAAIGQFQPGSAGGANSGTGFDSKSLVNPWDFVLMLEGSILFATRATRRFDPNAFTQASAPFAVRSHAAGFASAGSENAQRGEQWMPLWRQPAMLADLVALLGEARAQIGRQLVSRPVDMVRAVSRLGVARGIDSFVRYGYLERNGLSTLAVPLGRIPVRYHPQGYLIDDLAGWMDRINRAARDEPPARLIHAERRLADAVFAALTHDPSPDRWQAILLAAADIEVIQASGTAFEAGPIPPLRPEWIQAIDDGSTELRLALALASAAADYRRNGSPDDPVRHHFLPLAAGGRRFQTAEKRLVNDPRVVVSGRGGLSNLAAIVERRLIEAEQAGQRRLRLVAAAGCGASLGDLARFISGAVDLDRLLGLARALMALRWNRWLREMAPILPPDQDVPDESWLALRLCVLPWPLDETHDIPADERVVRLIASGDAARAVEAACRRLRSVGIRLPIRTGFTDQRTARRWAAALAFPITVGTARRAASISDPSLKKGLVHA